MVERAQAITGRIDLVHLNDSRDEFGSARDRHANIGEGTIDPEQLAAVCAAADAPVVVETPAEGQAARHRVPPRAAAAVTRDGRRPGLAAARPAAADAGRARTGGLARVVAAVIVLLTGVTLLVGYAEEGPLRRPDVRRQGPQHARLRHPHRPRRLLLRHPVPLARPRHRQARLPLRPRRHHPAAGRQARRGHGRVPRPHRAAHVGGGDVRPQRRRVPALLGAADGPVRPAHRVDARQARAVARARVGPRATAVPLRLPQLGPAGRRVRGGRRLRGARLAHAASLRQRATSPPCCSASASRSSSTRARSSRR